MDSKTAIVNYKQQQGSLLVLPPALFAHTRNTTATWTPYPSDVLVYDEVNVMVPFPF
jgi:hypothetical protein